MLATPPSDFSIGKNTVYPGETVTCTWKPSIGDFDSYRLEAFEQGLLTITSEKQSFTVSKTATSYTITIPENASVGNHIQFVILAQKGTEDASSPVGVYPEIVSDSPVAFPAPAFITVGEAIRGSTVMITWSAVSGAVGYRVQRYVNGIVDDYIINNTSLTEMTDTAGCDTSSRKSIVRRRPNLLFHQQ